SKNVKCCEQHTYRLPPSFLSTIHPQPRSTLFPYTTLFRSGRFHPGGKACAFLSPGVASGATRPIESVANTDCSRHSCSRHGMQSLASFSPPESVAAVLTPKSIPTAAWLSRTQIPPLLSSLSSPFILLQSRPESHPSPPKDTPGVPRR